MILYTKINKKNGLTVKINHQTISYSIKIFLNLNTKFSSLRHFGSL